MSHEFVVRARQAASTESFRAGFICNGEAATRALLTRPRSSTEIDALIEDPVAFTRPWTGRRFYRKADFAIVEMSCMDNYTFAEYEKTILDQGSTP